MTSPVGLENPIGSNNCFLNVIVQALYHIDSFRMYFLSHPNQERHKQDHGSSQRTCVYCELQKIIENMYLTYITSKDQDDSTSQAGFYTPNSWIQRQKQLTVSVESLRQALSKVYQSQNIFQIGQLNDATEVLEGILDSLHTEYNSLKGTRIMDWIMNKETQKDTERCPRENNCPAHQVFNFTYIEQIECLKCKTTSEPLSHDSFIFYVYAREVEDYLQSNPQDPFPSLGRIVSAMRKQILKSCSNEKYCKEKCPPKYSLLTHKQVFTLGVVWESRKPTISQLHSFLHVLQKKIVIQEFFDQDDHTSRNEFSLVGMVCYYGVHYVVFFLDKESNSWYSFNDTNVTKVESWESILEKCMSGLLQPTVIFFQEMDREETKPIPINNNSRTLSEKQTFTKKVGSENEIYDFTYRPSFSPPQSSQYLPHAQSYSPSHSTLSSPIHQVNISHSSAYSPSSLSNNDNFDENKHPNSNIDDKHNHSTTTTTDSRTIPITTTSVVSPSPETNPHWNFTHLPEERVDFIGSSPILLTPNTSLLQYSLTPFSLYQSPVNSYQESFQSPFINSPYTEGSHHFHNQTDWQRSKQFLDQEDWRKAHQS